MFKYISIILLLFCACSETEEPNPSPKTLLSHQSMINILKDIQLAEAHTKLLKINRDSLKSLIESHYLLIFKTHQIKKDAFLESYSYYLTHPDELNIIYESVLEELLKLEVDPKN